MLFTKTTNCIISWSLQPEAMIRCRPPYRTALYLERISSPERHCRRTGTCWSSTWLQVRMLLIWSPSPVASQPCTEIAGRTSSPACPWLGMWLLSASRTPRSRRCCLAPAERCCMGMQWFRDPPMRIAYKAQPVAHNGSRSFLIGRQRLLQCKPSCPEMIASTPIHLQCFEHWNRISKLVLHFLILPRVVGWLILWINSDFVGHEMPPCNRRIQ